MDTTLARKREEQLERQQFNAQKLSLETQRQQLLDQQAELETRQRLHEHEESKCQERCYQKEQLTDISTTDNIYESSSSNSIRSRSSEPLPIVPRSVTIMEVCTTVSTIVRRMQNSVNNRNDADELVNGLGELGGILNQYRARADYQDTIIKEGGIQYTLTSMKTYMERVDIQRKAFSMLFALVECNAEACKRLLETGFIDILISVMSKHVKDGEVQREAVRTMTNIATYCPEESLANITNKMEFIGVLVMAMQTHPKEVGGEEYGYLIFKYLAGISVLRCHYGDLGVMECILSSMKANIHNDSVRVEALDSLVKLLSYNDQPFDMDSKNQFGVVNGIEYMFSLLKYYDELESNIYEVFLAISVEPSCRERIVSVDHSIETIVSKLDIRIETIVSKLDVLNVVGDHAVTKGIALLRLLAKETGIKDRITKAGGGEKYLV